MFLCQCRSVTFEEADNRLVAGWHVELPEADVLASAQRKRYLKLERERLLTSVGIPTNEPLVVIPTDESVVSDALTR